MLALGPAPAGAQILPVPSRWITESLFTIDPPRRPSPRTRLAQMNIPESASVQTVPGITLPADACDFFTLGLAAGGISGGGVITWTRFTDTSRNENPVWPRAQAHCYVCSCNNRQPASEQHANCVAHHRRHGRPCPKSCAAVTTVLFSTSGSSSSSRSCFNGELQTDILSQHSVNVPP